MNLMEFKYGDWHIYCSNLDMINNQYRLVESHYAQRLWVFESFESAKDMFVKRVALCLGAYPDLVS